MYLGKGILDNPQMGKTMENENVIGTGIIWRLNRDNIQLLSKLGLLRDHDRTRGPSWWLLVAIVSMILPGTNPCPFIIREQ